MERGGAAQEVHETFLQKLADPVTSLCENLMKSPKRISGSQSYKLFTTVIYGRSPFSLCTLCGTFILARSATAVSYDCKIIYNSGRSCCSRTKQQYMARRLLDENILTDKSVLYCLCYSGVVFL